MARSASQLPAVDADGRDRASASLRPSGLSATEAMSASPPNALLMRPLATSIARQADPGHWLRIAEAGSGSYQVLRSGLSTPSVCAPGGGLRRRRTLPLATEITASRSAPPKMPPNRIFGSGAAAAPVLAAGRIASLASLAGSRRAEATQPTPAASMAVAVAAAAMRR